MNLLTRIAAIMAICTTTLLSMHANAHYQTERTITDSKGSRCSTLTAYVGLNRDIVFGQLTKINASLEKDDGFVMYAKLHSYGYSHSVSYSKSTGVATAHICRDLTFYGGMPFPWSASKWAEFDIKFKFIALQPGEGRDYVRSP